MIKYDEYDLLELFEEEPIEVTRGIYWYKKMDAHHMRLELFIDTLMDTCEVRLYQAVNKETLLMSFKTGKVSQLISEEKQYHFKDTLKIVRNEWDVLVKINFFPRFNIYLKNYV